MNDTDLLITIGTAFVMVIFILLWLIDGGTVVTFAGAVIGLGVLIWLAKLGLDE